MLQTLIKALILFFHKAVDNYNYDVETTHLTNS
jgi:hypothetical protein